MKKRKTFKEKAAEVINKDDYKKKITTREFFELLLAGYLALLPLFLILIGLMLLLYFIFT